MFDPFLYQDAVHYGRLLCYDEQHGTSRAQSFINENRIHVPDDQQDTFRAGVHAGWPRFDCTSTGPVPVRVPIPVPQPVETCDCGADYGCCDCDEEYDA